MKKFTKIALTGCLAIAAIGTAQAQLFSENFGNIANGSPVTTSNTSFTYVRASTGASAVLEALNPGSFTGASGLLSATNTSITGLGVLSGTYNPFDVGTLSFSLRTPADLAGTFFMEAGTGTSFTNSVPFSTTDLTFGIQLANGVLQTRSNGAFTTFGSGLAASTSFDIQIVFNNSTSTISYAGGTVASKSADFLVNGTVVGDDIGIQGSQSATGFRVYTVSDAAGNSFELDNVMLATLVPEPSVYMLLGVGILLCGQRFLRGRRSA